MNMHQNKKKKSKTLLSVKLTAKKMITICLLAVPFLLLIFPALDIANQSLTIFPVEESQNNIFAWDDKGFYGTSEIESFSHTGDELRLKYLLKKGAPYPMVFIDFPLGTIENPLDISEFSSVTFVIKEATVKNFLLYFKTFVPGISQSQPENVFTLRHSQYTLKLTPGVHRYTIGFNKFATQPWWFAMMKLAPNSLPKEDFKKVIAFDMQFNLDSSDYIFDKHEKIVIESMVFNKPMSGINQVILTCIVLIYLGFYIVRIIQSIRSNLLKIPERKPVQVVSYYEQDLTRIKDFLQSHYSEPGVSTQQIYKELGIPQYRVAELLRDKYHLTFKQLIIKMRIEEAKQLLKQTDLRIIDIAIKLGFNNIPYFNNLFKANVGTTPSEFREQEQQTKLIHN